MKTSGMLDKSMPFPCGKCPPCRLRRAQQWIFRVMEEQKRHISADFVTFTYADGECDRTPNGFLTLNKKHFQVFMQTLRDDTRQACIKESLELSNKYGYPIKIAPRTIRYFACGEYGTNTDRPHYHAIIFGSTPDFIERAWRTSEGVCRGNVHFGDVRGESVAYVTKYIMKEGNVPKHGRDDRIKEFQLTSNGLGANYITDEMVSYHHADLNRNYVTELGGVKVPMPRYYRDKIYSEEQREIQRTLLRMDAVIRLNAQFNEHCFTFGLTGLPAWQSFAASKVATHRHQMELMFKNHVLNRKKL